MAWANVVTQVTWGGSNMTTVSAGGTNTSDTISITGSAVERWLRVSAKGTAEADKKLEVHVLAIDDTDADAADDTDTQHTLCGTLDLGNTPAVASIPIELPPGITGFQVQVTSDAATNSYTVGVVLHERTWT